MSFMRSHTLPWCSCHAASDLVAGKTYDSVLVHTRDDVDRDMKGVVGNMSIKLNALAGEGAYT